MVAFIFHCQQCLAKRAAVVAQNKHPVQAKTRPADRMGQAGGTEIFAIGANGQGKVVNFAPAGFANKFSPLAAGNAFSRINDVQKKTQHGSSI